MSEVSVPAERIGSDDRLLDRRSAWWFRYVGMVGLALAVAGLVTSDVSRIDGLGLLPVPSPAYYIGLALVIVGAVSELATPTARSTRFGLHLIVIVLLLHGLPALVEANPRFPSAYIHVGFADQIATDGVLLPLLDARFSWPSFFAGAALIQQATDTPVLWLVRFAPVVVNLVAAAAVLLLGRVCGVSVQRCRTAALVFVLLNWVGQDYFSPQAIGFVVYLAIICCVLVVFPGVEADSRQVLRHWLRPRPITRVLVPPRTQRIVLLGLVLAAGVLVTAHQLTPGFLAASLILLALVNATRLRFFGFVVVAMTVGWLSYAGEAYWRGHLDNIVGSFVQVGELVQQNVGKRTGGGTDRLLVVTARIGLSGLVAGAVLIALVVLWRRRSLPLALAALVVAPAPLLLAAAYGGEMSLRVFLFALPAASLLIAEVVSADGVWSRTRQLLVSGLLVVLLPCIVLARFGNETFEQVSVADRSVLTTLYEVAPDDSVVYLLNSISVRDLERVGEIRFRTLGSLVTTERVIGRARDEANYPNQFVMVTDSQEAQGVQLGGQPPGWAARIVEQLLQSGEFAAVQRQGDAALLRYIGE